MSRGPKKLIFGGEEKTRWLAGPTPGVKKTTSGRIGVEKIIMGAEKIRSPDLNDDDGQ